MKILLDTCAFLWIISDASELSTHARELFVNPENDIYLSSVSSWEICIKHALGRLPLPQRPEHFIPAQRKKHAIETVPLEEQATLYMTRLPEFHKDPFDRMLISQAIVHQFNIMTPDELILQYPVRSVW
ncbi:MAG: type II toxin-antitoxin system VapC family toxin [Deltaproteobacteria bacterium]|nr:type II toxin-antitoxin system VapC family toxin [Deltaproteobacteria bacterium]